MGQSRPKKASLSSSRSSPNNVERCITTERQSKNIICILQVEKKKQKADLERRRAMRHHWSSLPKIVITNVEADRCHRHRVADRCKVIDRRWEADLRRQMQRKHGSLIVVAKRKCRGRPLLLNAERAWPMLCVIERAWPTICCKESVGSVVTSVGSILDVNRQSTSEKHQG